MRTLEIHSRPSISDRFGVDLHALAVARRSWGGLDMDHPRPLELQGALATPWQSRAHRNAVAKKAYRGMLCRTGEQVAAAEKGWGDEDHGNGNVVHLIDGNFAE